MTEDNGNNNNNNSLNTYNLIEITGKNPTAYFPSSKYALRAEVKIPIPVTLYVCIYQY